VKRWVSLLLLGATGAQAEPFFLEHANPLRLAQAAELLRVRIEVLRHQPSGEATEALQTQLPLIAGSLTAKNPALLGQLEQTLRQLAKNPAGPTLERARELLERAQRALIPGKLRSDPAFQAAVIVRLLRSEGGVSEGYEAAGGEEEAYVQAWAGFQRVKTLWTALKPTLQKRSLQGVREIERALGVLGQLLPSAKAPARLRDPEDAERAALDVSFALEAALSTQLLPRDLPSSLSLVRGQAEPICLVYAKHQRLALEYALTAQIFFQEYLEGTLATLEPALHRKLAGLLERIPKKIRADAPTTALEPDCKALKAALAQAGATLR
jgi:hypothetical protein